MDEFKKYLQQHRHEMDEDIPSANLLQRIHANKARVKKASVFSIAFKLAAAACILAFIMGGSWLLFNKKNKPAVETATGTNPLKTGSSIPLAVNTAKTATDTISDNNPVAQTTTARDEDEAGQLLQSFSHNYTQLVNLQLKHIRNTPVYGETGDYFNDFKHNLDQLDKDELKIKFNIKHKGLDEVLLEQLINVYQQKINLLKDLQHEINKLNNRVRENQLPSDSLQIHYINI
jgi:hypothetical protein